MAKVGIVSHVMYRVWNREVATDFLVNALGGYLQRRGSIIYVGFGDTLIEMSREQPEAEAEALANQYTFGLEVEDLDEVIADLEAKGATVVRPISATPISFWGRQAVVSVPGGTPIALREWRAPDGPHFTGWKPEEKSE